MAIDNGGPGRSADNVIATMAARAIQLVGIPIMLAMLYWLGAMLSDSHDRLTRIDQNFMDWRGQVDSELTDHETRLRRIEQPKE